MDGDSDAVGVPVAPMGAMKGLYHGTKTVWMRSLRFHTYEGKPQDEGAVYLAHDDPENIANIETLGFAVRDTPPPTAARQPDR